MTRDQEAIVKAALSLPTKARAELARVLLESLEGVDDAADQAWREEVRRRIRQLENGEVETIPWEQVRDQMSD